MLRYFFLLIFSVFLTSAALADKSIAIPARPEPKRLVNDMAGLLTEPKRTEALEYKLNKLNDSLGVEIFIVTVESLRNIEVGNYARELASVWEDANDKENGIFILFDYEDRGYAIIPGTKFREKFHDIIVKKIEAHYLKPHFKKKQFYEGFNLAADAIANHITGKLTDTELKTDDEYDLYLITLGIFFFFLIFFPLYQYYQFKKQHFGTKKIGFVSAFMLMNHLKPSHSTFDDFKKGTGSFSVRGASVTSFGGGAGGSWGGW
ncbi:MAG TPA: TPM domain-containing protein [Cytophagaceae bacterium]|nr:TPM domain-containing protein [Cytophagaceae bacterium]